MSSTEGLPGDFKSAAVFPKDVKGMLAGMGWNSQANSTLEFVHLRKVCAQARVYLYQAPFSPSVRYADGTEVFLIPAGWALMRSRAGLLVWLELFDDAALVDVVMDLASSVSPGKSRPSAGPRTGSPSPSKRPAQLLVSFPAAGAAAATAGSGGGSAAFGQAEIRCSRAGVLEQASRVAAEDTIVLRVSGNSGLGFRAPLGASFDETFKAWLSEWETVF